MSFKIGDTVTGKSITPYSITTKEALLIVVSVDGELFSGRLISHKTKPETCGEIYHGLDMDVFVLRKQVKFKFKPATTYRMRGTWKQGIEELLDGPTSSTSSYITLHESGSYSLEKISVCHAGLKRADKGVSFVVSRIDQVGETIGRRKFYNWLIKRSVYSPFIVNSHYADAVERGLILRTNVPSNLMLQALILSRYPNEWPESVEAWNLMVDAGIDEDLAILLTSFIKKKGEGWCYSTRTENHRAFSAYHINGSFVKNYLARRVTYALENYYIDTYYRNIFSLFTNEAEGRERYMEPTKDMIIKAIPKDMKTTVPGWSPGAKVGIEATSSALLIKEMKKVAKAFIKEVRK